MENGKYNIDRIRKYLADELSPREMFLLERQAEDDPALKDLIEGMAAAGSAPIHRTNIDAIKAEINTRYATSAKGKTLSFSWRKWAVAASIVFVAGLGALFLWFPSSDPQVELAEQATPPRREAVIAADSEPEQESVMDGPAPVAPASSTAGAGSVPSRAVVRPTAVASDEDRLASTAPQKVLSALSQADSRNSLGKAELQVATPDETPETVLLAGRLEAADANSKRLAMAIRSLPTDTLARPLYRTVAGVVREHATGNPVAGVSVYGANGATHTAMDGKFTVTVPAETDSLKVVSLGFKAQALDVRNRDSVVVELEPAEAELSEVVVVGYQRADERYVERANDLPATDQPKPISGWANFEQYLGRETASSSGKGTVTLKFTVGDKGQPVNLQLEHTTNPALVKRAMEILQAGPRWEQGPKGERSAIVLVEFR